MTRDAARLQAGIALAAARAATRKPTGHVVAAGGIRGLVFIPSLRRQKSWRLLADGQGQSGHCMQKLLPSIWRIKE